LSIVACAKSDGPEKSGETSSKSSPSISTTSPSTASSSPSESSQTPSEKTPSEKTPSEKTPSEKTPSEKTPSEATTKFKDGSYDEKGDPWAQGQEEAIIIIKDKKIINVTLMRLDKAGKEIDYTKFDGKEHEGKLYPNLKEIKETLAKKIIEIQSAQIDTVSGATVSTGNWKVAVQKALDKAKEKAKEEEKGKEKPKE
jgi:uncharacterized protein with FMN-binding domain